jgi:hypothetical protein
MSILKDRIRPLDPSSNQEFLEPDREAGAEGGSPEPFAHPLRRTSSTPEEIITSAHETVPPSGQLHAVTHDAEGLGTRE